MPLEREVRNAIAIRSLMLETCVYMPDFSSPNYSKNYPVQQPTAEINTLINSAGLTLI